MPTRLVPNTLLSKVQNVPITDFSKIKNKPKYIRIPQGAKTFDFVQLADKNGQLVKILTFRDTHTKDGIGEIVKRYIVRKGWTENITEQTYIPLKCAPVIDPETYNELPVKARKISTVTKSDGKYIGKTEEIQAVTYAEKPKLHISKVSSEMYSKSYFEKETQSFYSYQNRKPKKGYQFYPYLKSKGGYLDIIPRIIKYEGFSDESQKIFDNDKYLPLHLYSFKQFKKIAPTVSGYGRYQVKYLPEISWRRDMGDSLGTSYVDIFSNEKYMALNDKLIQNRYDVVNTSAHENRHAYEGEQIFSYGINHLYMDKFKRLPSQENLENFLKVSKHFPIRDTQEAIKYGNEIGLYKNYKNNPKGYIEQESEQRARFFAMMATDEYYKSVQRVQGEFPYAPKEMLGARLSERIDYDQHRNLKQEKQDLKNNIGEFIS